MDARQAAPCPDYGGACLTEVVPTILRREELAASGELPGWFPPELAAASQVVLLVLDGLGYRQLRERSTLAPTLSALVGGPISSVAPTTTATALTSITTGCRPCEHGLIGYRFLVDEEVLNVLRWSTPAGDARERIAPRSLQHCKPFRGAGPIVVTRAEFAGTGFTDAHETGGRLAGWRMPSSIAVEVGAALRRGEHFVYAYYDGVDKIAHEHGLGEHYGAELEATDALVAQLLEVLPSGAALAVTADHGQVEVLSPAIELDGDIAELVVRRSGEGRFRWLHACDGATDALAAACSEAYGELAWVMTRAELVDGGYLGGPIPAPVAERLGDVALVAAAPVAFADPEDSGELRLVARHGSLTPDELEVPFLVGRH